MKINGSYVALLLCFVSALILIGSHMNTLKETRNELITKNMQVQTLIDMLENDIVAIERAQQNLLIAGKESELTMQRKKTLKTCGNSFTCVWIIVKHNKLIFVQSTAI